MTSHAARRADGSKPVVGSSRKMSSGSPIRARANVEPPPLAAGQRRAQRVRLAGQADQRDGLVDVPRLAVVAGVQLQALAHGQAGLGL